MKKNCIFRIIAIALAIMSIMIVTATAYAGTTAYVNVKSGTTVNVRDWPGGNVVFTLKRGTMVTIVAAADSEYDEVQVSGRSGTYFIMRKYLSKTKPIDEWIERYGEPTLKYNPKTYNKYVANLQRDLRKAGYTSITKVDGYFGDQTRTAVKNFQRKNGLKVDGLVGAKTKEALWKKLH